MSWLLKQAEDILNRVDQQTGAALHQHASQLPKKQNQVESISDTPSFTPSIPLDQSITNRMPTNRPTVIPIRRTKKTDETDLINYLNSSTPINTNEIKQLIPVQSSSNKTRTNSSSAILNDNSSPVVSTHNNNNNKELVLNIPSTDESIIKNSDKQLITILQAEIQTLTYDKQQYENELHTYKRQLIQYQNQIAESDALLRDLRSRESDSNEVLSAKDSQIALLRVRLAESDELLRRKTSQYDELHNEYTCILQDSSHIQSASFDSLQLRKIQLEQELERNLNENERLNNENEQLIEQLKLTEKRLNDEHLQFYEQQQQTKHAKNLINQLEYEMNEYKSKAQRILQTKDKLIIKLKDIIQHRSSTPNVTDQHEIETIGTSDDASVLDGSLVGNSSVSSPISNHWASIQYEELKDENELFKQELQARELTIHTLRNELQEAELTIQHSDEQYQEQINQLNEQLKEERSRLILAEQDYRKLKQELSSMNDDFHKQKQIYQGQLNEREREIERLRLQLTAKTINHVNDDELEKRLQTLTESLIHKQTIIETLQTDKSSLTMQLERLEKRLDDYEIITSKNSLQQSSKTVPTTSISIDDPEHYENLRYRMPLLRETPYDVDLTKKVKRAANELDKLGIRFTIFLRRYPAVRLGVLFYIIILHLWTFIVLFTYTPEIHTNTNSINVKDKL
ncbi:unnamed protein product [Rotaria sp. Silwood2]|nr:unnamed protein product [Rotaria sp. Silwood2]CAF3269994.1 unnamed protein product [Rotaria sp. Silwood2]CAF4109332.1 unnamed protein product [Rotaria sp. Silwood2]CAF4128246.1 unnamed protein product [Rotaria sp. Silwood2]